MAENLQSLEDQAALYVLGRLAPAEREEFEAVLKQSPELLKLVRELEDGSLAMALTAPPRVVPAAVWERVAETIARESKEEHWSRWRPWLRTAWAAAAACMAGWFLHALWTHSMHSTSEQAPPASIIDTATSRADPTSSGATIAAAGSRAPEMDATNVSTQPPAPLIHEMDRLRWQVAALQNQVSQLAQVLAHQQEALSESGRPKFFQLAPNAAAPPPSPELQQVLFTAMARELGWLQATGSSSALPSSFRSFGTNNSAAVEFVDFRPRTNSLVPAEQSHARTETESLDPGDPLQPVSTGGSAPMFVAGNNAFLAFDSSVMPVGSYLTFWTGTPDEQSFAIGTTMLGNGSLVVAVPFSAGSFDGGNLLVTWGSTSGLANSTNVLGQFTAPGNAP